tara:strand:- start:135 stop:461 length:327 start_codon:yes stop_codon:yes gene_type:complete
MIKKYKKYQDGGSTGKKKSFGVLKSDASRPKDKPLTGPKPLDNIEVKEIKDKINRLEESFKSAKEVQTKRGYSSFTQTMRDISKEAEKLNKELIRLTGKGSPLFSSKQ